MTSAHRPSDRLIVRQKRVLCLLDVDIDRAISANGKSAALMHF